MICRHTRAAQDSDSEYGQIEEGESDNESDFSDPDWKEVQSWDPRDLMGDSADRKK